MTDRSLSLLPVFGGTFDPVHIGHLRSALEVREALACERVLMVPAGQPPHGKQPVATAAQRLQMLQIATAGVPALQVDAREIERPGLSYMVDTLQGLREEYPAAALCLIVGNDAFAGLPAWHRWRDLPELAHLVVLQRPGGDSVLADELVSLLEARRVADAAALTTRRNGLIVELEVTPLAVASSQLRAAAAAGHSLEWLIPEPVLDYIDAEGLY